MCNFILNNENTESDSGILEFLKKIKNGESIIFETSGTTGLPKKITHDFKSLTKNIKIKNDLEKSIWGLTYDYKKIAGSQVILQSFLNNGKIVNLFKKTKNEIIQLINEFKITHISATPTFYRLLIGNYVFDSVKQLTLGGEVVDELLIQKLNVIFPNAKITNIYALTEFGTLFASNNFYFELSEKYDDIIKIEDNHIFVNQNGWVDTGDVIEMIDKTKFKIVGRVTNMINVGGVKINPIKVENMINNLDYVTNSYVYSRKNSLVGNVVVADVILKENIDILTIKNDLKEKLNTYEIPMIMNIVENININSTGKVIRL